MPQLFINNFQKGGKENSNLGMGNLVSVDLYSKKGVARLAKKITNVTQYGGIDMTAYPTFIDQSQRGKYTWAQLSDGNIIYTADAGLTWQNTSSAFTTGADTHGNGMIFFQNFMFAWTDTKIWYWKDSGTNTGSDPTNGAWVDWTSAAGGATGALQNFTFATDPVTALHFPFFYPSASAVYFGNGNAGGTNAATAGTSSIGKFGQVGSTPFWPGGTRGTDFFWDGGILQLPSFTYAIGSISFLPPTSLAFSAIQYNNPAQGSDLITWDTVSANKFNPPLRIFSNINSYFDASNPNITAAIKQIYNRNQVLYAVTGGNHTVYETNGSSFNLLEDIGLYSNIRNFSSIPNGGESDYPVFYNSFPSAIGVVGNKLLTGTAPMTNSSTYPPANNGFFPVGVWTISFDKDGSHTTQCEFIPSTNHDTTSPSGTNNFLKITAIKPINTVGNTTGQILIGYAYKGAVVTEYGFGIVDLYNYTTDITKTAIESELFEIGTYLSPKAIGNIEVNFVKKLKTGQTFDLAYRVGIEDNWTFIPYEGSNTVTGDNTKNSYSYTSNAIGAVQFIQFRLRMATDSGNATNSPELRTVVINPLDNN